MTESETRVLGRAAAVLLLASLGRFAWDARRPGPAVLAGAPDDGPALLAESRRLAEENAERARPLGAGERLDPNRATAVELDRLPGVGPAAARAIVATRERSGGFASLDELLSVPGIGSSTLERMRPHLEPISARAVGRRPPARAAPTESGSGSRSTSTRRASAPDPAPLDVNRATAAELERLPGVGPALASRILEQRTKLGRFGTLDDLLQVRGIGPKTLDRLRAWLSVGG